MVEAVGTRLIRTIVVPSVQKATTGRTEKQIQKRGLENCMRGRSGRSLQSRGSEQTFVAD